MAAGAFTGSASAQTERKAGSARQALSMARRGRKEEREGRVESEFAMGVGW
jgi:hypothetical protein